MQQRKKKNNSTLWALLVAIVVLAAIIFALPSCLGGGDSEQDQIIASTIVKEGDVAPLFNVAMVDGTTVSLESLRGKVVLLNFWATWCPPCREELARVQSDIVDRFEGEEFVFLPISRGEKIEDVLAFRELKGYTFPMGIDPGQKIFKRYASNYIPRNFLINKEGEVVEFSVGYEDAEFNELVKSIEEQLKK